MESVREIDALAPGRVVYHSAFGFARIHEVDPEGAVLLWEGSGENLPTRAGHDTLRRVYALCRDGGFFHRAIHAPEALAQEAAERPLEVLVALLSDLHGPQRPQDLQEWLAGRGVVPAEGFERWWRAVLLTIDGDARLSWTGEAVGLAGGEAGAGPIERLRSPTMSPSRRLDVALAHREEIGEELFLEQALLAWRTGGTQVKDLALAALKAHPPSALLRGLVAHGTDAIDAIIHGIRRAGWEADAVDAGTHALLMDLVVQGALLGGAVDGEGRLAATLYRWPSPGAVEALADVAPTQDGKRLLRATFAALPPRRAEILALDLLDHVLDMGEESTAQWLGSEALAIALVEAAVMAERLDDSRPGLADWFRDAYVEIGGKPDRLEWDDNSEETPHTAEIDLSDVVNGPIPLGKLPPRSGGSLLGLGLAIARALAAHHKDGRLVYPTAFSVFVLPNETIEIEPGVDGPDCPRARGERPSPASDVYAAAVLLLEALIGRPWPPTVQPARALPYLRTCVGMLPPSVLAPLDIALHPDPRSRPADGLAWLALWQTAAVAEENRGYATRDIGHRLHIGYDSHIGRAKILLTQTNQDSLYFSTRGPLSLLCVCDGISTANAGSGDVASSIATQVIANVWEQALPRLADASPGEVRAFIDRALRMANTAVCEAALRFAGGNLDGRVPMGTTCVIAVVHGTSVHLAWLGDSRAYLVGPYGASLLTADENQAGERLKAWHLRFIEAWEPAGFALVGYLGHFNELYRPEALGAHHAQLTMLPGEYLVMSSDGVTDYVGESHPEVAQVLREQVHGDPDDIARRLVGLANRGGGGDNATCLVATLLRA